MDIGMAAIGITDFIRAIMAGTIMAITIVSRITTITIMHQLLEDIIIDKEVVMDCDCDKPDCMECFERRAKAEIEYLGGADKHLYYEWQDIRGLQAMEEQADQDPIPEEVYNLKDSW